MNHLRIAPIVEGDGEVIAVRMLLERIGHELAGADFVDVLKPVRVTRTRLLPGKPGFVEVNGAHFANALRFASAKLAQKPKGGIRELILVLLDADHDCPKQLVPRIATAIGPARGGVRVAVVMPVVEYESWFVAAATSLAEFLDLREGDDTCDPERNHCGKAWISDRLRGGKYVETRHQIKLTRIMDLLLCRKRSPSFDKLCREMEEAITRDPGTGEGQEAP